MVPGLPWVVLFGLLIVVPAAADPPCITGSITAAPSTDPGFENLWKYTVTWDWNTSKGLSHADVFVILENLECRCHPGLIRFPDPAGTSDGETPGETACQAVLVGEYVCMGDPSIPEPMNAPAVKFEHADDPECEPGKSGSASACFYTVFPPAPYTVITGGLAAKHGTNTCLGDLSGTPPLGDCALPTVPTTWGTLKSHAH